MDEITKGWLEDLARKYPRASITISHQFLDGSNQHEAGFVPNDWDKVTKLYFSVVK